RNISSPGSCCSLPVSKVFVVLVGFPPRETIFQKRPGLLSSRINHLGTILDFWRNSGFHLLERDAEGRLGVTDDFLRAYLLRPEIRPVEESGPNEIALHEALMDEPRRDPPASALEAVEDADARENYRVLLAFFGRLKRAASLESCYLEIF